MRYCDDFLLFENDKKYLNLCRRKIHRFIHFELKLQFSKADLFDVKQGVDFVGYRSFGKYVLLRKSTAKRLKKKVKVEHFRLNEQECRMSRASVSGWLKHCCSFNFKVSLGFVPVEERWFGKAVQKKRLPLTRSFPSRGGWVNKSVSQVYIV